MSLVKNTVIGAMATGWFVWGVALPLASYNQGTSDNVAVRVVAEPFIESPVLVYNWSGDIVRSCEVTIRRTVVDSRGVETTLVALGPFPPSDIGPVSQEVRVNMPFKMPAGPAIYQPVEISSCSWMQRLFPNEIPYPAVQFNVHID